MESSNSKIIAIVAVLAFGSVFAVRFIAVLSDISRELKYLNMEIKRAEDRKERCHWRRKRLRLFLCLIPFVSSKLATKISRIIIKK